MDKIVTLKPERSRPRRNADVPRSGARILFFTGVRYCRDDLDAPVRTGSDFTCARDAVQAAGLDLALDLAAH